MTQEKNSVPFNRHRKANSKANLSNRSNREATQQKKKKSVSSKMICKGKSVVEPSKHMDDFDQAIGMHFEEEIIMDILSKLPVRSLLRFKCVSKFWKTLICDRNFKKKHLNHAQNDENSQKFLVSQRWFGEDGTYNIYCSSLSSDQTAEDIQKLDFPLNPEPLDCKIWCSCDGLFLLAIYDGRHHYFLLWNPSTSESMVLPRPKFSIDQYCTLALGYDATSDDYKILKVDLSPFEEIFTLKHGSWRARKRPEHVHPVWPFGVICMDYPPCVHGAFHWLAFSENYYVVSFSISNEVYGDIPLLEGMFNGLNMRFIDRGISEMGGMLCLYSTCDDYGGEGTFKLWVMRDYGVKESWTVLLVIQDANLHAASPKYRFADGEVLLNCIYWGRIGSAFRTSKKPFGLWPQCGAFLEGFAYTESLISPK